MWSVTYLLLLVPQAYELSTLTGTQVLLLVASETGHVYTFATRKLQPMITSETGKALIQTCLNSPDSPPRSDPSSDQRMSATGFEETDLSYQVAEHEGGAELTKVAQRNWSQQHRMDVEGSAADWLLTLRCVSPPHPSMQDLVKPTFTVSSLSGTTPPTSSAVSTATGSLQVQTNSASWQPSTTTNGTLLKTSAGVVLPGGFTLMSGTDPLRGSLCM